MTATTCYAALMLLGATVSTQQQYSIDTSHSVMRVRVYKAGALGAFGHDHVIAAPIVSGKVDLGGHRVELQIDARSLAVEDPKASEKDRAEIQKTMLGGEVLDAERYPQILFRSVAAEGAGANAWRVNGNLTLHGETRPVTVEVSEREGHFIGHSLLRQSDFGMKPISKAGGTVRVKDEVRIEFDIGLTH
jgi:polyisoprenoid-binding protein YceI